MIQYLDGDLTLEEATDLLKKDTRNFAKRQRSWFRRDNSIYWVAGAELAKEIAPKETAPIHL